MTLIAWQRHRLVSGAGYAFATADAASDDGVGQIGLWLRDIGEGRASTGYLDVFGFELTSAELDAITGLGRPDGRLFGGDPDTHEEM